MAGDQRFNLHVADELDIAGAAKTKGSAEGVQWCAAFAKLDPVDLQLLAHRRLKTHDRIYRRRRPQVAQIGAQLAHAALIAASRYLTIQNGRRYHIRLRSSLALLQIELKRSQLGDSRDLAFVLRQRLQR